MSEVRKHRPAVVTAVPDAGRFVIEYDDGLRRVIDFPESGQSPDIIRRVITCLISYPENSSEAMTAKELLPDIDQRTRYAYTNSLARFALQAPEIVRTVASSNPTAFRMRSGTTITRRAATAGELVEYHYLAHGTLPDEAGLEALKLQAEADEKHKLNLAEYDHATIHIEGVSYVLPFTAPDAYIACRALECIADYARNKPYKTTKLCLDTFRRLSLAERAQLIDDEQALYLPSKRTLREPIKQIIGQIAGGLYLTRFYTDSLMNTNRIIVTYSNSDYQASAPGVRLLMPPGSPRDIAHITITAAEEAEAQELLQIVHQHTALSHTESIRYLDLIMSRSGKLAYLQAVEATGVSAEGSLSEAHALIRSCLGGAAYYAAVRARRIAGNGFTNRQQHGARQTSGSGIEQAPKDDLVTRRKWEFVTHKNVV